MGRLFPDEDGDLKCANCGFTEYFVPTKPDKPDATFTDREKDQINDALHEQYMRAKGNARRSKLESSQLWNLEHAEFIDKLMKKVRNL